MAKKQVVTKAQADKTKVDNRNEQAYALNESGLKRFAEMLVKIGVAAGLTYDRSWAWLTIPQEKAKKMATDFPAFRVFFDGFSPRRGAWFGTPKSLLQYAERASDWGVMLSPDGKGVINAYDLDTEWGKHQAEHAVLKVNGQPNEYGAQSRMVEKAEKQANKPAGKVTALTKENADLKAMLAQMQARLDALENKGKGKKASK